MSIEKDLADLKAATREAHEAMKDLRALLRECREIRDRLILEMAELLQSGINTIVKTGLDSYLRGLDASLDRAETQITRKLEIRFKALFDTMDELKLYMELDKERRQ